MFVVVATTLIWATVSPMVPAKSYVRPTAGDAFIAADKSACQLSCQELAKTFFRLPYREGVAEFQSYPLEKQYAVFICGNQYIHPPQIELAHEIARMGPAAVGFLSSKLEAATDDLTIRDIVNVFSHMSAQQTYNVRRDDDLLRLLEDKVASMKDPNWKDVTLTLLNRIKKANLE